MKIFFPILSILIAVLIFIYAINPLYAEVTSLKSDILVYNTALDNSTSLQRTEDELLTTYNSILEKDKDRLSILLPDSVNNIQLILQIERIANIHNMPVKDFKFDQVTSAQKGASIVATSVSTDNRPYGVFPIQFTTEGTYKDFALFLKALEANLRLADIKEVSFVVPGPVEGKTDSNIYKYSMKVETYWLK